MSVPLAIGPSAQAVKMMATAPIVHLAERATTTTTTEDTAPTAVSPDANGAVPKTDLHGPVATKDGRVEGQAFPRWT
jgi:hypothetical protein